MKKYQLDVHEFKDVKRQHCYITYRGVKAPFFSEDYFLNPYEITAYVDNPELFFDINEAILKIEKLGYFKCLHFSVNPDAENLTPSHPTPKPEEPPAHDAR